MVDIVSPNAALVCHRLARWWPWRCKGTGAWEGGPTPRRIHSPIMWGCVLAALCQWSIPSGDIHPAIRPVPILCARALLTGSWSDPVLWIAIALLASGRHFGDP